MIGTKNQTLIPFQITYHFGPLCSKESKVERFTFATVVYIAMIVYMGVMYEKSFSLPTVPIIALS